MYRILLVDDEPDVTNSIKLGLERQEKGFVVDVSNDPVEALANFKAELYDLLLLDIKMPIGCPYIVQKPLKFSLNCSRELRL
jgi:DNA-binding response OmpR family regulator